MTSPLAPFANYVGDYEIRPDDGFPEGAVLRRLDRPRPYLVQTGKPTLRQIKGEALEMAVRMLLDAKLPSSLEHSHKEIIQLKSDQMLLGEQEAEKKYSERTKLMENLLPEPASAEFGETVLKIASRIGMLTPGWSAARRGGKIAGEPVEYWVEIADTIQAMFHGRNARRTLPRDFSVVFGELEILLAYRSDRTEMRLRTHNMRAALIYHAAQMIAAGTNLQACEHCEQLFLSGGMARGGGKRRRDARFCSDKCRWEHHNATRKSKTRR